MDAHLDEHESRPKVYIHKSFLARLAPKFLIAVILLIILIVAMIVVENLTKAPLLPKTQTSQVVNTTPLTQEFPKVVRVEEQIPQSLKQSSQSATIILEGVTYTREQALVKQVIKSGQSYKLTLSDNREIIAFLDSKTLLAKALFGYDKNNTLTNIQYQTINQSDLSQVEVGKTVSISYQGNQLTSQKTIKLTEFVLME